MRIINELSSLVFCCDVSYHSEAFTYKSPFFELFTPLDGSVPIYSCKKELLSEEILFLPPRVKIDFSLKKPAILLRLSFISEAFLDFFDEEALPSEPFTISNDNSALFSSLLEYARLCISSERVDTSFLSAITLLKLLKQLSECTKSTLSMSISNKEEMTSHQKEFLNKIFSYVELHSKDSLSLSDIAGYFSVTPQYLASFFKKYTGQTVQKYIQEVRCKNALLYFQYTNLSFDAICQRVGLHHKGMLKEKLKTIAVSEETSPFSHTSFGTPLQKEKSLEYLNLYKITASPFIEPKKLKTAMNEINVSVNYKKKFPDFWNKLINLGYAADFENVQLFDQLIQVQKEIGFTYGRICRIFDLTTKYTINEKTIYDYNRIFRILDLMIEHHMIPFLEISNKLFRIQLSIQETIPINLIKDSTSYYDWIIEVLPDFIRTCINRYGQTSFDKWRFEVSYTYHDFIESAETFSLPKYIQYFRKIKDIIKGYSSFCQVGGPGFNNWKNPQKLLEFCSLFQSYHTMPDFISAYIYPLTREDAKASISQNENLSIERLTVFRDLIRDKYPDIEIWITEFNSNLSSRNLLNDSCYQASYLAKLLVAASNMNIQAMGYYLLSDVPLRYVDSFDLLFGGLGLFTDKNMKKPSYHAYRLFGKLGIYLFKYNKKFLITGYSDYSFQCLFFHYEHISPKFCKKNVAIQDFSCGDTLYTSTASEHWNIHINNARSGIYLVKEYVISDTQSNLLHEWEKIKFITPSKANDLNALAMGSALTPNIYTLEVPIHAPLSFSVSLKKLEIKLLMIDLNDTIEMIGGTP